MSCMRGAYYFWRDDRQIHFWAAAGYDGWDQSVWAEGQGIDTEAVAERPETAPSGVGLPQAVADEYVLLRLAELLASGAAVATLKRALASHGGNGGAMALAELAPRLRAVLAGLDAHRAAT